MSFCYSVIGYKTAWLSCHYPAEFAVANCTINEDTEAITATLTQAKKRHINVLPPDINHSDIGFSLDNGAIRYGLKAIKGIGSSVLKFIKDYRDKDPVPFKDFDDYYNRIHDPNNPVVIQLLNDLRAKTGKQSPNPMKKDVEIALILSGSFDFSEPNRYVLLQHYIGDIRREKSCKVMGKDMVIEDRDTMEKKYKRKDKLAMEKFYMGSYISEHPLDPFPYADFEAAKENEVIKTSGIVCSISKKKTKTDKLYIALKIKAKDDIERTVNVFNEKQAERVLADVKKNSIVIITGRVSKRFNNINASSVAPVIFQKQSIETEALEVQDDTKKTDDMMMVSNPLQFGDIFSQ